MKIRILDRILVAVAGLLMLACAAAAAAQLFFQKDVVGWAANLLTNEKYRVWIIIAMALLILLGLYCFLVLFRHRGWKDKFILQKTDNGELAISLKAMETMVQKCLEPHKELNIQSVHLENQKGGLLIKIRGTVAGGVSIPLTVDALQQQIKQYVTACSGVEVKDIRVEIESSGPDAKEAMFAIDAPAAKALPASAKGSEAKEAEKTTETADEISPEEVEKVMAEIPAPNASDSEESEPAIVVPAAAAAAAELVKNEAPQEEDDRPIHQRLFSSPEEPCVMPMPPEEEKPEENEPVTEKPDEARPEETKAEEPVSETPAAEGETAGEAAKDEIPENKEDEGSKKS
jgi:hypothetical protein